VSALDKPAMTTKNPYASPATTDFHEPDEAAVRLRAVSRVFRALGWLGVVIYSPVTITCVVKLVRILAGDADSIVSAKEMTIATAISAAIVGVSSYFVITGRKISAFDLGARRQALVLACLMMTGFPIFTLIGAICFRDLTRHLRSAKTPRAEPEP